jgi:hypothetical protein
MAGIHRQITDIIQELLFLAISLQVLSHNLPLTNGVSYPSLEYCCLTEEMNICKLKSQSKCVA